MDLTKSVYYRGLNLNSIETMLGDGKRRGTIIEEVNYSEAPGVGYKEKRAQDDGYDATDVFLGMRSIRLDLYVYGENVGDLWDRVQDVRSALTPSAAYLESPGLDGYLPLQFYLPTLNLADFGEGTSDPGYKPLQFLARPVGQPNFAVRRDMGTGGNQTEGQSIRVVGYLECKDPRMYVFPQVQLNFSASTTGDLVNRGDYPAPLSLTFRVDGTSAAGTVLIEAGGARMNITVPNANNAQTFRYDGNVKVLTVEENDIEVLRMDLLNFESNTTHPKVPSGISDYIITIGGGVFLNGPCYLFFSEAFA